MSHGGVKNQAAPIQAQASNARNSTATAGEFLGEQLAPEGARRMSTTTTAAEWSRSACEEVERAVEMRLLGFLLEGGADLVREWLPRIEADRLSLGLLCDALPVIREIETRLMESCQTSQRTVARVIERAIKMGLVVRESKGVLKRGPNAPSPISDDIQ